MLVRKLTIIYQTLSSQGATHERASRLQIPTSEKTEGAGEERAEIWLRDQRADGTHAEAHHPVPAASSATDADAASPVAGKTRPDQGALPAAAISLLPVREAANRRWEIGSGASTFTGRLSYCTN